MSKGVKKQWGKSKKEISFQANQRDFFPVWSLSFSPLQKERILVIPGGYRGEAGQQWREHP